MMDPTMLLLGGGLAAIFVSMVLMLGILGVFTTERQDVARTLAVVDALGAVHGGGPAQAGFGDRVVTPFFRRMTALGGRLSPTNMPERIGRRLDLA